MTHCHARERRARSGLAVSVLLCTLAGGASANPARAVGGADHVGLSVTDLAASTRFFTEALGFEVVRRDPDYPAAFLSNGEILVTLWRVSDPKTAVPFDRKKNVGLHHLAFAVASFDALDALHERLRSWPGVRIEFAPELLGDGPARHMMLRDPSGNRIELIHRPGAPRSAGTGASRSAGTGAP